MPMASSKLHFAPARLVVAEEHALADLAIGAGGMADDRRRVRAVAAPPLRDRRYALQASDPRAVSARWRVRFM